MCATGPDPPEPVPNAATPVHRAQSILRWPVAGRHRLDALVDRHVPDQGEVALMEALMPLARLIVEAVLQEWLVVKQALLMRLAQVAVRQN